MRDFFEQDQYEDKSSKSDCYDIAQICFNEHVINSATRQMPEYSKPFCDKCGEKTIAECPACNKSIQGYYWGGCSLHDVAPQHCIYCGQAFPWTQRKIEAAIELFVEESQAQGEEAEEFKRDVSDIVKDTPRVPVAASRFKRAMKKVGDPVGNAIRDIIVDIASESAKKIIWPDMH
jgi:hypothetical protein